MMMQVLYRQLQVQLVDVVEGHLVPVASEHHQLLPEDHRTVAVPSAGLFADDDVGVVVERLEELGD